MHLKPLVSSPAAKLSCNAVELCESLEDDLLGRLLHLTAAEELVQDQINLVEVENEVQLADV